MEDLGAFFDPTMSDEPWIETTPKAKKKDRTKVQPQRGMAARSLTFADLKSAPLEKESAKESRKNGNGYFFGTVRTRMHSSYSEGDFTSLPPEPQQGNIEYKLKLVNPSSHRLEHLVTQMKWRLREGQGEAIYEIGVEDNGLMTGLCEEDMISSLDTLREMARRLGATIEVLRDREVETDDGIKTVAEILVRKVPDDQQYIDLRVSVLGSFDVGKSTLLGVLTQGDLDNGRGRARLNMFRHLHEIQSGRTSSISHEILGFDSEGRCVDYTKCKAAEEICDNSSKVITFIDLGGHQKYLKTTIYGLTGYSPHYAMLVVSANAGVVTMTMEHLNLLVALDLPFFIVVTKVDVTSKQKFNDTMDSLKKVLASAGIHKVAMVVNTGDDIITAASNTLQENIVPIFCVSAVTGKGLGMLKRFLHLLPPGAGVKEREKLEQLPPEFQVDELFDVPGVGTVVGGLVTQGIITEAMRLKLGPFEDGSFRVVTVTSIKRNRAPCRLVRATQSAALALNISYHSLRKGMVLVDARSDESGHVTTAFTASVSLLYHPKEILAGFRTTVHVGNVRQTAVIEKINPRDGMKSSESATVEFRFIRNPEFIRVGTRILFREGRTKGIGIVTKVESFEPSSLER